MSVEVVAPVAIGVGIDTARYGHHATFLRPDSQPAAANLTFAESSAGYAQLEARLRTRLRVALTATVGPKRRNATS